MNLLLVNNWYSISFFQVCFLFCQVCRPPLYKTISNLKEQGRDLSFTYIGEVGQYEFGSKDQVGLVMFGLRVGEGNIIIWNSLWIQCWVGAFKPEIQPFIYTWDKVVRCDSVDWLCFDHVLFFLVGYDTLNPYHLWMNPSKTSKISRESLSLWFFPVFQNSKIGGQTVD